MTFVGTGSGLVSGQPIGNEHRPGLHHPRFLPPDQTVTEVATSFLAGYLAARATLVG